MSGPAKRCPHATLPATPQPWFRWHCAECGTGIRMRALSLTNPYPFLMLDLPDEHRKDVENRKRPVTKTMGPVLLHAAKGCTLAQHVEATKVAREAGVPPELLPQHDSQPAMGLVGAVVLTGTLPAHSLLDAHYRWKFKGWEGYTVGARVKLPFRGMPGSQGIFYVDLTPDEEQILRLAGLL